MDHTSTSDQSCGMMKHAVASMEHCRGRWVVAGIMAGAALLGAGAYLAWNSRQAKMLRAAKRTGKILRRTGIILQSVADATE